MSEAFTYRVSITHVSSGQTVEFDEEWDYPGYKRGDDWEYDPVFLWSDGNYSCNCNRDLFFNRVSNPTYGHRDDQNNCNEFDDYKVNWIKNNETGRTIYEERG